MHKVIIAEFFMLRSNFDKINVTDIDVLEKASLNVQKVFNLYLELIFILDYLETSRFSYYFQNRTNLRPKEVGKIIKNAVLKYINELNFDLNNFKEKVGCFYFKKREDKLKVKDIDLENDTYLAFVTWRPFPREEKFLSLSAYFSFRIDAITSSFKEIEKGWNDKQFLEYKRRMNSILNIGINKFPKIFRDYAINSNKSKNGSGKDKK